MLISTSNIFFLYFQTNVQKHYYQV